MAAALTRARRRASTPTATTGRSPRARSPAPPSVDCGLAGTVMRFVPPVAALADGPVVFDGDPHARNRPMGAIARRRCAALGVDVDDDGRGALPFTVRGAGAVRGGRGHLDASASSPVRLRAAAGRRPRTTTGVDVRHDGKPVPSLPHIDMTVAMLRERGVEVDDSEPDRVAGRPGPVRAVDVVIEPDLSNAAPFLAAAGWSPAARSPVRDWPRRPPRPATRCARSSPRMGATVDARRRRPDRHRHRTARRASTSTCTTSAS